MIEIKFSFTAKPLIGGCIEQNVCKTDLYSRMSDVEIGIFPIFFHTSNCFGDGNKSPNYLLGKGHSSKHSHGREGKLNFNTLLCLARSQRTVVMVCWLETTRERVDKV